jgi:hypothetical protein
VFTVCGSNLGTQLSTEAVKGILVNPLYTGVGPFPRLVEDAAWVGS